MDIRLRQLPLRLSERRLSDVYACLHRFDVQIGGVHFFSGDKILR